MAKTSNQTKSSIAGLVSFFPESWAEIKKVRFPTGAETVQSTLGVMILMFVFALFLGCTDYVVGYMMKQIML